MDASGEVKHFFVRRTKQPVTDGASGQFVDKSVGYTSTVLSQRRLHEQPVRTIKKYPNRRLYDTANSGYITLADVKQMVLDNIDFQVVDAKDGR
jgi:hypothetical protein